MSQQSNEKMKKVFDKFYGDFLDHTHPEVVNIWDSMGYDYVVRGGYEDLKYAAESGLYERILLMNGMYTWADDVDTAINVHNNVKLIQGETQNVVFDVNMENLTNLLTAMKMSPWCMLKRVTIIGYKQRTAVGQRGVIEGTAMGTNKYSMQMSNVEWVVCDSDPGGVVYGSPVNCIFKDVTASFIGCKTYNKMCAFDGCTYLFSCYVRQPNYAYNNCDSITCCTAENIEGEDTRQGVGFNGCINVVSCRAIFNDRGFKDCKRIVTSFAYYCYNNFIDCESVSECQVQNGVWGYENCKSVNEATCRATNINQGVFNNCTFERTIHADNDNTKEADFSLQDISSNTKRTFTYPDNSGVIALTSDIINYDNDINYLSGQVDDVTSTVESNSAIWALTANYDNEINYLSGEIDNNSDNINDVNNSLSGYASLTEDNIFEGNQRVLGNVRVDGTFTATSSVIINTEEIALSANFIDLNNNASGVPTEDAGIRVIRGISGSAEVRWNELTDKWQAGISGSLENIAFESDINNLQTQVNNNNSDINYLSGQIDNVSGQVQNVANYAIANRDLISNNDTDINYLSGQIDNNTTDISDVYSTVESNSSQWDESSDLTYISGRVDENTNNIDTISGKTDNVYSTVESNSGSWSNGGGTDLTYISGRIDDNTDNISTISGDLNDNDIKTDNVYSTVETNSGNWGLTANYDSEISSLSSDVDDLSSNLNNVYSTVESNSSQWDESSDLTYISGKVDENTNNIDTISGDLNDNDIKTDSVYSIIESNSGNWSLTANYDNEINYLSGEIDNNSDNINDVNNSLSGYASLTEDNIFEGSQRMLSDLRVDGTFTATSSVIINAEQISLSANFIELNNNVTGIPYEDAGVRVKRGLSTDAELRWNELTDKWQAGITGALEDIALESDISGLQSQINSNNIDINYLSGEIDTVSGSLNDNDIKTDSVYSTVENNSGSWELTANYDSEINYLSGEIDNNTVDISDVYSTVETNSGSWALTANYDNEINYLSGQIDIVSGNLNDNIDKTNHVYSTVENNSAQWDESADLTYISGRVDDNTSNISSISGDLSDNIDKTDSVYSTVDSNSGNWSLTANYDNEINYLSGQIDNNTTDISDVYSTVESNSSQWDESSDLTYISGKVDENTNNIDVVSGKTDSVYSTVESNSGNWSLTANYDNEINYLSGQIDIVSGDLNDNDIKTDSVYSTVESNSSNWSLTANYDNEINYLSGEINDVTSTVASNSAQWDESSDLTYISGQVDENSNNINSVSAEISAYNTEQWDSTYSTVNSNSAEWSLTANYDSEINYLSGQIDVVSGDLNDNINKTDNIYSTVESNSAQWDESNDLSYISGKVDSNIDNINSISAEISSYNPGQWDSVYSTVDSNSANWGLTANYDSEVNYLSGQIDNNSSDIQQLSSQIRDEEYIPLSGSDQISGSLIPSVSTATLGTSSNPWKEGYFSSGSVYVGDAEISSSGTIIITPDFITNNIIVDDFIKFNRADTPEAEGMVAVIGYDGVLRAQRMSTSSLYNTWNDYNDTDVAVTVVAQQILSTAVDTEVLSADGAFNISMIVDNSSRFDRELTITSKLNGSTIKSSTFIVLGDELQKAIEISNPLEIDLTDGDVISIEASADNDDDLIIRGTIRVTKLVIAQNVASATSADFNFLSGQIDITNQKLDVVSGDVIGNTTNINNLELDVSYLSGQIDNNINDIINISSASGNWDSTYSTVNSNSAEWSLTANYDSEINYLSGQIDTVSGKTDNVYSTVASNSGGWGSGGDLTYISGKVDDNTDNISSISAEISSYNTEQWDSAYSTVESNSSTWSLTANYDSEINYLSGEIDNNSDDINDLSAAITGEALWDLSGSTLVPQTSSNSLTLPYLSGIESSVMITTISGLVEDTTVTIKDAPSGGSILNITEYQNDPLSSELIAGDLWVKNNSSTSGKMLKYWDGTNKYSVELAKE